MLIYKKLLRCLAIMMQLQQHQSLSSRLKLIERRLEAAVRASDTQYEMVVSFIKKTLEDNSADMVYIWKLNEYFGVKMLKSRPVLNIDVTWGKQTSNLATLHIDSEALKIHYSYHTANLFFNAVKPEIIKLSDIAAEDKTAPGKKLIDYLLSCVNLRDFRTTHDI
jgi:hypothetical protein